MVHDYLRALTLLQISEGNYHQFCFACKQAGCTGLLSLSRRKRIFFLEAKPRPTSAPDSGVLAQQSQVLSWKQPLGSGLGHLITPKVFSCFQLLLQRQCRQTTLQPKPSELVIPRMKGSNREALVLQRKKATWDVGHDQNLSYPVTWRLSRANTSV